MIGKRQQLGWAQGTVAASKRAKKFQRRPMVEGLEERCLLSVSLQTVPVTTAEGMPFSGMVANFRALDPAVHFAGDYGATIAWGDGTPPTAGTITQDASGQFNIAAGHTYAHGGSDTVMVSVTEKSGVTSHAFGAALVAQPPAAPQLNAQSDSGVSKTDGITRNNGSVHAPLSFTVSGISPANGFVRLYDVTSGAPLQLGDAVQAADGTATIALAGLPLSDGVHMIAATTAAANPGTESARSPATRIEIHTGLEVLSVSPKLNENISGLPNNQIVVHLSGRIQGLTEGDPSSFATAPFAVFLVPRGPDGAFAPPHGVDEGSVPIHANLSYHAHEDGTSDITLTPAVPLSTDIYAVGVSQFLTDLAGNPMTDAVGNAGTFFSSFLLRATLPDATAPMVTSITTFNYNGRVNVDGNQIPQPDTIAIAFSKSMSPTSINASSIRLRDKAAGTPVSAAVIYSPGTHSAYLTPTAPLAKGKVYTVEVDPSVSDDQNFPDPGNTLGKLATASFTVTSDPAPGRAPLQVAHDANNVAQTQPLSGTNWTLPTGYAALPFSETVSRASLGRYSIMLIPRSGGLDPNGFDAADVPVNAKLAINPNTNQVILVPTEPLANDFYVYSIGGTAGDNSNRVTAANSDGSANFGDPLLPLPPQPTVPVYGSFILASNSQPAAPGTTATIREASSPEQGASQQAKPLLAQGGARRRLRTRSAEQQTLDQSSSGDENPTPSA